MGEERQPRRRLGPPNKRVVVCCDGTWNEPEEAAENPADKAEPTNVLKIARGVSPVDAERVVQVVYYDEGVGTGAGVWDKWIGGGLGQGISDNIRQAYLFIANNYHPGDDIFLFGFSRGAYTVRSLAGFIGFLGLLEKDQLRMLPEAYALYRTPPDRRQRSPYWGVVTGLPTRKPIAIEFVGVFDTVGALGSPTPMLNKLSRWFNLVGFHNTQLGGHVRNGYHALAVDERRRPFQPDLWTSRESDDTNIEQVWFAGVHSNVGGSYKNPVLSDIALRWMADRAKRHGLALEPHLDGLVPGPIGEGRIEDSFTWGYHALRLARVPPYLREIGTNQRNDIRTRPGPLPGEMIHETAAEAANRRLPIDHTDGSAKPYAPENLDAALAAGQLPVCR